MAAGGGPAVTARSSDTTNGVTVTDITFDGGRLTDAYLVTAEQPVGERSAGILWFHWLETGSPTSNRTEFLDEAGELARRGGVASLLVEGTFPWHEAPTSIDHDKRAVEEDLTMLRQAYALLLSRPDVDASRIALVGHDFGGMYSSLLFGSDMTPTGLVMMTPTARWADWFLPFWHISDYPDAYRAVMAPLDPIRSLTRAAGRPILLQFARTDQYVPPEVADEVTAAAGRSAARRDYDCGHELNEAARADRREWLAGVLGLPT